MAICVDSGAWSTCVFPRRFISTSQAFAASLEGQSLRRRTPCCFTWPSHCPVHCPLILCLCGIVSRHTLPHKFLKEQGLARKHPPAVPRIVPFHGGHFGLDHRVGH